MEPLWQSSFKFGLTSPGLSGASNDAGGERDVSIVQLPLTALFPSVIETKFVGGVMNGFARMRALTFSIDRSEFGSAPVGGPRSRGGDGGVSGALRVEGPAMGSLASYAGGAVSCGGGSPCHRGWHHILSRLTRRQKRTTRFIFPSLSLCSIIIIEGGHWGAAALASSTGAVAIE